MNQIRMSMIVFALASFINMNGAAEELRSVGFLGNSGESGQTLVTFAEQIAPAIGPIYDQDSTLWERAGSTQLNRYALDGRLLASYEIPDSQERTDQLALADGLLLLKIKHNLLSLPLEAAEGSKPQHLMGGIDLMSSGSFNGKVAIYKKNGDELSWFDPTDKSATLITHPGSAPQALHVDELGIVYLFARGEVQAWQQGKMLDGFPKQFSGERPQKVGKYWYSHGWHGTIHRMNKHFEPAPGVVLGGASGSFIGYLPQSVDVTKGCGLVHIRDEIYAVSGQAGIIQLLVWDAIEMRFKLARRIGALPSLSGLAVDSSGNIWTPYGSWRWDDTCASPLTLGDKEPDIHAQPIVLNGETLCLLKKHYSYVQLAHGSLIDDSGWSHLETPAIKNFDLNPNVTGAVAIPGESNLELLFVEENGKAFQLGINSKGQQRSEPVLISLPGLKGCTSLAWMDERLYAADSGRVISFERQAENVWKEDRTLLTTDGQVFIHSDGQRLAVCETDQGRVQLFDSELNEVASFGKLSQPTHVALFGERLVLFESGKQRLLKLTLAASPRTTKVVLQDLPPPRGELPHLEDSDYQELTRPGGISLAIALLPHDNGLIFSIRTQQDPALKIKAGIANATNAFLLSEKNARHSPGQFDFKLPKDDWSVLRLAISVELPDQRERFHFADHRAIHADFSADPNDWQLLDFQSYQDRVHSRREEIRVTFDQPFEGKATIVIEDENLRRIRSLVSGRSFTEGRHTLVWDGMDENGKLVAPGSYAWRGISHPGVQPVYKMNFANGGEDTVASWGPNHSTLQSAAANDKLLFFAAPVTEGGWALMALNSAGEFVQGYEHLHGYGIGHDAIAADDRFLYCAQDGFSWRGTKDVDLGSDDWTATWRLTIVRYDIATGKVVEWPGKQRAIEVSEMKVGPGVNHSDLNRFNLAGITVHDGKLYVGSREEQAVIIIDCDTGKRVDSVSLPGVRCLASRNEVYAATDRGVFRLRDGKQLFSSAKLEITGLTIALNGDILLSDARTHQIHRFSSTGTQIKTIGKPGGPYRGQYDPARMVNPMGLVFGPDGKLWVTENRWNPKRVFAWDLNANRVVYEKFGMPHYGGDGSGFDPENSRRWIGLGCFWDLDLTDRTAKPTHILSVEEGHFGNYHPHSYQFFREKNRTFVCARGKISLISEVMPDGTLHDLVATAGTHHFAYGCNWEPPQAYIDAFYERWPEKRHAEKPGRKGEGKPWAQRGMGVLWVDKNGDGQTQKDEFSFCGDEIQYAGGSWGHLQNSLTLYVPLEEKGQVRVTAIKPRGFLSNGVPDYPQLEQALSEAIPIDLSPGYKRSGVATARDSFGRFIFNSDPEMNAYQISPESNQAGKHLWSFPNQWSDVHGSHKAPLPEPGVMQGTMAILGLAPFDEQADVMFLNGNHGRCFLLTTDGLYLDEAFVDVRVSYLKNEYRLGGEIFGGTFGRSESDQAYYVQIGHGPYRIYELAGLNGAKRMNGKIHVTKDQILAAEQKHFNLAAQSQQPKKVTLPGTIRWDKDGRFPVQVDLNVDNSHLHLRYQVQDDSPWVNNGRDWTKLFATGDTVDLQIGTDPKADSSRKSPVAGDKRLLITPYEGQTIAVLYEHRLPGGKNPIEFTSPWRGEKVDHVQRLDDVKIQAKQEQRGYTIEASIPLMALDLTLINDVRLQADFGVTYGDAEGTDTNLRSYWSNQSTGLVDDIPGEIMLSPNLWGEIIFSNRED